MLARKFLYALLMFVMACGASTLDEGMGSSNLDENNVARDGGARQGLQDGENSDRSSLATDDEGSSVAADDEDSSVMNDNPCAEGCDTNPFEDDGWRPATDAGTPMPAPPVQPEDDGSGWVELPNSPPMSQTCDMCLADTCGAIVEACRAEADCLNAAGCLAENGCVEDTECLVDECFGGDPDRALVHLQATSCVTNQCGTGCLGRLRP